MTQPNEPLRPGDNPRAAKAALDDTIAALESLGITTWLTGGVLLGAIRERSFVPHDLDMDVGAMINQYTPEVNGELTARGFTIRRVLGDPKRGLQTKLARDGFYLDIFWHTDTPDGGVVHSLHGKGGEWLCEYSNLVLARIKFLGSWYWAPHPPRLALIEKYGMAWRTPMRQADYHWARTPKNVTKRRG